MKRSEARTLLSVGVSRYQTRIGVGHTRQTSVRHVSDAGCGVSKGKTETRKRHCKDTVWGHG